MKYVLFKNIFLNKTYLSFFEMCPRYSTIRTKYNKTQKKYGYYFLFQENYYENTIHYSKQKNLMFHGSKKLVMIGGKEDRQGN